MTPPWDYFWPALAIGFLCGAILGTLWLRRKKKLYLAAGIAITIGAAALWHWPLGAADRLAAQIERTAEGVLADWEMSQVDARLHRDPLSRRLILSGRADRFQRSELVQLMSLTPGVSRATWSNEAGIPLIAEALLVGLAGFLFGLLLAYVVELRRRYNAQWKW